MIFEWVTHTTLEDWSLFIGWLLGAGLFALERLGVLSMLGVVFPPAPSAGHTALVVVAIVGGGAVLVAYARYQASRRQADALSGGVR